jgi:hypothetical protein
MWLDSRSNYIVHIPKRATNYSTHTFQLKKDNNQYWSRLSLLGIQEVINTKIVNSHTPITEAVTSSLIQTTPALIPSTDPF